MNASMPITIHFPKAFGMRSTCGIFNHGDIIAVQPVTCAQCALTIEGGQILKTILEDMEKEADV